MIRNVSIRINGVETHDDTQIAINKYNRDCLLTEWDNEDELKDLDLKNDEDNEYDIFIDIVSNENLDNEAKLYKKLFENMRDEFIKLQKLYLDLLYKDIDSFKVQ